MSRNADGNRQRRESEADKVKALVTWYEKNKPEAGKRIEVQLGPKKLAKQFGISLEKDQTEFVYRDRTIVAIGKD